MEHQLDTFLEENPSFHLVPKGYRYGAYYNDRDSITFIREFWSFPRIVYKDDYEPERPVPFLTVLTRSALPATLLGLLFAVQSPSVALAFFSFAGQLAISFGMITKHKN